MILLEFRARFSSLYILFSLSVCLSIWTHVAIRFEVQRCDLKERDLNWDMTANICDWIWKRLKSRQNWVTTHNWVHEPSKHFCFGCSLMPKLHCNRLIDIYIHPLGLYEVYRVWICLKYSAPNIAVSTSYWKLIYGLFSWKIWDLSERFDLKVAHRW